MSWFPPYDTSSAATILGYKIYGDSPPWWIKKLFNIQRKINSVWYWFYYRTVCKRHIVKLPIKPSYIDIDEVIFLSCFEALGDFVENELGPVDKEWDYYKGYRLHSGDQKAIDLWIWYKKEKDKNFPFDNKSEEIYDQKLKELINIRRSLWT